MWTLIMKMARSMLLLGQNQIMRGRLNGENISVYF